MGRPGINYHDVAQAAQQLVGLGKNPTIEAIRALIGTGSSSTIAPHLRTWRTNQDQTQQISLKENLPEEFVSLMKGLWERVVAHADEQVISIKQNSDHDIIELKNQLELQKQESAHWQQQFNQLRFEKDALANDKLSLEQAVHALQTERANTQTKHEYLVQQLQDKQERIDELHRLHQQSQQNLEHYREASRQQRLLDQERYENQLRQQEQTIQLTRQELSVAQQQKNDFQQRCEQSSFENNNLQDQLDQLTKKHEVAIAQLQQTEKELIKQAQSSQIFESECQKLKERISSHDKIHSESQKTEASLTQKILLLEEKIKELTDQNKSLASEKWMLGQEKAQLLERLKQDSLISR